jgi:release factor glutamine methyltransferase
LIEKRAQRVPLQHLTGTAPFLNIDLKVGPGVFIPRPETELLARWGIDAIADSERPTVVDLCSGSGALALAIASARPDARVYAVERSEEALKWLWLNASGSSIVVVEGDVREVELPGGVDLVLSNPPYVPAGTPVAPEVLTDPPEAVFAGTDGLDLIPALIDRAAQILRPGGHLGFEHDESHVDLADLLRAHFESIESHRDLAERPRFTTAIRKA